MVNKIRSLIIYFYYRLIDERLAPYYLQYKGVQFDRKAIILRGVPYVARGPNSIIRLGAHAVLNSRERSNSLALDHATSLLTYENARIIVGDHCAMSGTIIVAQTSVEIGEYTIIGANTRIYDTDFHPTDPDQRREHPTRGAKTKPISIGKNVFIGCHVHILKGVTVADNAVVPAGLVVYRDFPETRDN